MDKELFIELMDKCDFGFDSSRGTYRGLTLMGKYIPTVDVDAAEHDKIYASCEVDQLLEAGITEEDTIILSGLGWMTDDSDYIAKHV